MESGTRRVNWECARQHLNDDLTSAINSLDPAAADAVYPPHARTEALRKFTEFDEDVSAHGPIFPVVSQPSRDTDLV